jgi:hypothetical protein
MLTRREKYTMSDNAFEVAFARYTAARQKFMALDDDDDMSDDAVAAVCDELRAAQWALIRTPATSMGDIQQRARMV